MSDTHCRSSDTALVAYLKSLGSSPVEIQMSQGTCYWFFERTPEIESAVETYAAGRALVEPSLYNRLFGETKRELFDKRATLSNI